MAENTRKCAFCGEEVPVETGICPYCGRDSRKKDASPPPPENDSLDKAAADYLRQGYKVEQRDGSSLRLRRQEKFNPLLFTMLLVLCVIPGMLYLIYYSLQNERTVLLERGDFGQILVNHQPAGETPPTAAAFKRIDISRLVFWLIVFIIAAFLLSRIDEIRTTVNYNQPASDTHTSAAPAEQYAEPTEIRAPTAVPAATQAPPLMATEVPAPTAASE